MPTDPQQPPQHPAPPHQEPRVDADHPGYEVEDVNTKGIAVFLAGLFGTVIIFFFVCYAMGKVIDNLWVKEDGQPTKWKLATGTDQMGVKPSSLASNAAMEQQELQQMTTLFPAPRLEMDDGNQATADLHAREDLLLDHYSTVEGQPGTIRIPIDRAMELIAQNPSQYGLPVASPPAAAADQVAYAGTPQVQAPLTTGFARTGYELQTIEAREERLSFGKATAAQVEMQK
jgi:hypothetical protein